MKKTKKVYSQHAMTNNVVKNSIQFFALTDGQYEAQESQFFAENTIKNQGLNRRSNHVAQDITSDCYQLINHEFKHTFNS
jgi:hypothetical protein